MKKGILIFVVCALMGTVLLFSAAKKEECKNADYLRIHIRADSNEEEAQRVKYAVRDRVVCYLTPLVSMCSSKEEAKKALQDNLKGIEETAEEVLKENGFSYGARASVREENFPTRIYEEVTLEAGVYDALILELGSGKGDNWWCVVYPPLCFQGGQGNVVYKSRIKEIIEKFFAEK